LRQFATGHGDLAAEFYRDSLKWLKDDRGDLLCIRAGRMAGRL
jgi:hypothetical protein